MTNGGPSSFQVLRPELPEGNLLNVMPIQGYATSTLVVTLENRDIPLVIRLESDSVRAPERKADALVLIQLAHHGPKAAIPLTSTIKETASSAMLCTCISWRENQNSDAPLQPFLKLSSFKTNCFITKPFAAIIKQWTSSNRRF